MTGTLLAGYMLSATDEDVTVKTRANIWKQIMGLTQLVKADQKSLMYQYEKVHWKLETYKRRMNCMEQVEIREGGATAQNK